MTESSIPKYLYKYQPLTIQTLTNLKGRTIWFSKPSAFNDPFECEFRIHGTEPSKQSILDTFDGMRQYISKTAGEREVARYESQYSSNGVPNAKFVQDVSRTVAPLLRSALLQVIETGGLCCFAERFDDILMWAHYANGHRGFCLEFNTSYEPFSKVTRVSYGQEFGTVDPFEILGSETVPIMERAFGQKATCWAYEKEWRVFHEKGDTLYGYGVEALTGIYLGPSMSAIEIDLLASVLQGSPTKLHRGSRKVAEFAIDFELINYTPYDYANRKDARSTPWRTPT